MDNTAQPAQGGPVSTPQKEQESRISSGNYIEQVERQPEIPPEVAQVGASLVSQPTPLTREDRGVGISEAGENVPVKTEPEGLVNLPLTEQEAKNTLRIHKKIGEAIVWLANFVLRQFKVIRLKEGNAD